ncbi:MAG: GNAT family N-acetyltransferase, partial [Planctomycetes bacterium]|nr:GNAT family N-acetyltransferase [Planctomycetota bacterium]
KIDRGIGLFQNPGRSGFLKEVIGELLPLGGISLWFLSLNDRPIACALCFVFEGNYYGYYNAFDMNHASCSPGMLIIGKSVESAFHANAEQFHLGSGKGLHKSIWTDNERGSFELHLVNRGSRIGGMISLYLKGRKRLKGSEQFRRMKTRFDRSFSKIFNKRA